MPKRRKIPTPSWEHSASGTLAGRLDATRWQLFATAGVILLIVAAVGVIGWAFFADWLHDYQRPGTTAIEVLDHRYTVRDFTERAELYVDESGGQNNALFVIPTVAANLEEEAILLQFAEGEGVQATEDDIKEQIALNLGITADDPDFDARFQEELDATGISEQEYRDLAKARSLKGKLTNKFTDELPATTTGVHYKQMRVADQATADEIVTELEAGGDFGTLYMENSTDYTDGDESGGDQDFVPMGLLNQDLETFLFGLDIGEFRTYATSNAVLVLEVVEKKDDYEPTDGQRSQLGANAYNDWLSEKKASLEITNEMDFQNGDTDKIRWVIDHANLVVSTQ